MTEFLWPEGLIPEGPGKKSHVGSTCTICHEAPCAYVTVPMCRPCRRQWKRAQKATPKDALCEICNQPEKWFGRAKTPPRLAMDHDHQTGQMRGLLCRKHNLMLGCANDDPAILQSGVDYLARYAESVASGESVTLQDVIAEILPHVYGDEVMLGFDELIVEQSLGGGR